MPAFGELMGGMGEGPMVTDERMAEGGMEERGREVEEDQEGADEAAEKLDAWLEEVRWTRARWTSVLLSCYAVCVCVCMCRRGARMSVRPRSSTSPRASQQTYWDQN